MYRYTCSTYHELWKQICDYTIAYNIIKWSVDVSVCRRFGLSTFCPVDVLVCRRFGLSTFWFVDVPVCRRFGLSTFWSVDVSVCRRFGLSTFWLSTFRFVDVLTSYLCSYSFPWYNVAMTHCTWLSWSHSPVIPGDASFLSTWTAVECNHRHALIIIQ